MPTRVHTPRLKLKNSDSHDTSSLHVMQVVCDYTAYISERDSLLRMRCVYYKILLERAVVTVALQTEVGRARAHVADHGLLALLARALLGPRTHRRRVLSPRLNELRALLHLIRHSGPKGAVERCVPWPPSVIELHARLVRLSLL